MLPTSSLPRFEIVSESWERGDLFTEVSRAAKPVHQCGGQNVERGYSSR